RSQRDDIERAGKSRLQTDHSIGFSFQGHRDPVEPTRGDHVQGRRIGAGRGRPALHDVSDHSRRSVDLTRGVYSEPEDTLLTTRALSYLSAGAADVEEKNGHICSLP